jgi:hypothetical protein
MTRKIRLKKLKHVKKNNILQKKAPKMVKTNQKTWNFGF